MDVKLGGDARFIKLKFAESDVDETMDLDGYSILYQPLDVY